MTAPISKQSEKGRFCSASCKMVVSLMTYKAFFKELERSSNLHPTGRTAVSLRQLQNVHHPASWAFAPANAKTQPGK